MSVSGIPGSPRGVSISDTTDPGGGLDTHDVAAEVDTLESSLKFSSGISDRASPCEIKDKYIIDFDKEHKLFGYKSNEQEKR